MKKIAVSLMALLMATVAANAVLPVNTIIHAEVDPQNRVTLQNGVVTTLIALHGLDRGTWVVSGSCTVQDTVIAGVPGYYLYTYSAISPTPAMPANKFISLDARPYSTVSDTGYSNLYWWFQNNPVTRVFTFPAEPTVYLLVESYGQVPPSLSQSFGAIFAWKASL